MNPQVANDSIFFRVHGMPKPAGSKRAIRVKSGKIVVVDTSGKAGTNWKADVQAAALALIEERKLPIPVFKEGPLSLYVGFHMPRPKSHYTKNGIKKDAPLYHCVRPDATKLLRAIEDALTGILWVDDAMIALQMVEKRYTLSAPYVDVVVQKAKS